MTETTKQEAATRQQVPHERVVMRKCAACGQERPLAEMKTCMDSRPMHRYVCDTKCMIQFYA